MAKMLDERADATIKLSRSLRDLARIFGLRMLLQLTWMQCSRPISNAGVVRRIFLFAAQTSSSDRLPERR